MKTVYFVRHGETDYNRRHVHQSPEAPLNEVGKQQAAAVAERLVKLGIDTLLSSPYTRAYETAAIISDRLDIPLVQDESVAEFRRPLRLYGSSHYSLKTAWYIWHLFLHRTDDSWDDGGAENMFDVRNRIADAKRLIENQSGQTIAVVSHSVFIDMFVQSVCADRSLHLREFMAGLYGAHKLPNTAVVAFSVDTNAPGKACAWWLQTEETDNRYLRYW